MAERKVLNKYYPPDFDPSKLRRFEKKTVRRMCNVRMMLPMSVRCKTCGNYMYIGTKFNMKVETVKDEDYLGIKIYRFYFKCTQCYSEITFRTDPKNHDYIAEWGASRNHEPWKDMLMAEEEYKEMKQNEMKEDAMKSLEHRTYDSKREMDILDALDQVKSLNRRQASINYQEMIDKVIYQEQEKEMNEIEKAIEKEAQRVYERMKIRRIRDYNVELPEKPFEMLDNQAEEENDYYQDDQIHEIIKNGKKSLIVNNKKETFSGIEEIIIKEDGISKSFNDSLDDKLSSDDTLLNKKTKRDNIESGKNNLNESDSINKISENQIKEEEIISNLQDENIKNAGIDSVKENDVSSDDSIEREFEQNKKNFNFFGKALKLKISKNETIKDKKSKNNKNIKNGILHPIPFLKKIQNKNKSNLNKVSGLNGLMIYTDE